MMELRLVPTSEVFEGFHKGQEAGSIVGYERGLKLVEDRLMEWFQSNKDKGIKLHQVEAIFREIRNAK